MKICTKCKIEKELIEFHRCSSAKSGLSYSCISCNKEYQKRYREDNKDEIYKYHKKYKDTNKDEIRARASRYYIDNASSIKKTHKIWRKTTRGMASIKTRTVNRRMRLKNIGTITKKEAEHILEASNNCYWCNDKLDKKNSSKNIHLDHYEPLFRGGSNTIDNIVVSCAKCNLTKSTKDPIEFANSVGKLF